MGFESFRVELNGGNRTFGEVCAHLDAMQHIKVDDQGLRMRSSQYYLMADGQHVIEIEVSRSPVTISCRFTLCHPPSVDSAFVDLLETLMAALRMEVTIRDDVDTAHAHAFDLADFDAFSSIVREYIASRRAEWGAQFGKEHLAATTIEASQRFIIPRCTGGQSLNGG